MRLGPRTAWVQLGSKPLNRSVAVLRAVVLSRCPRSLGEVPERSNGAVSKTVVPLTGDRGFESLPLRQKPICRRPRPSDNPAGFLTIIDNSVFTRSYTSVIIRVCRMGHRMGNGVWRMARIVGKLKALDVSRAKERGYYGDGGGLYLLVGPSGAKSWVFRFRKAGRLREMGLGPLHTISLARAREKAREAREQRLDGRDPIEAKHA